MRSALRSVLGRDHVEPVQGPVELMGSGQEKPAARPGSPHGSAAEGPGVAQDPRGEGASVMRPSWQLVPGDGTGDTRRDRSPAVTSARMVKLGEQRNGRQSFANASWLRGLRRRRLLTLGMASAGPERTASGGARGWCACSGQRHARLARHVAAEGDPPAPQVRWHDVRGEQLRLDQAGSRTFARTDIFSFSADQPVHRHVVGAQGGGQHRYDEDGAAAIDSIAFSGGVRDAYIGGNLAGSTAPSGQRRSDEPQERRRAPRLRARRQQTAPHPGQGRDRTAHGRGVHAINGPAPPT